MIDFKDKKGFWSDVKSEKSKALQASYLTLKSPKIDRLRAYVKYFPNNHPLQKHLSRAIAQLISEDSENLSPESSNNGLQEACWYKFITRKPAIQAGFCFAHFFDMKEIFDLKKKHFWL